MTEGPVGCWVAIIAVVVAAWVAVYFGGLWVIGR